MSLIVTEVLERSKQGRTEPYICRCDDGEVYFVKGRSATKYELVAEWLCAQLGDAFGLPIAPYAITTVPVELIEADMSGRLGDLGEGEAFASRRVGAVELTQIHRDLVPLNLRRDVIAFDWWVHNGDRNMTSKGGNPNLLWNPADDGSLVVIDHNLAFDPMFSAADFLELHVFADDIPAMFSDFLLRNEYEARFAEALGKWNQICDTVPDAWMFIDFEQTIPVEFSILDIKTLLDRTTTDTFWNLPT